MRVVRVVACSGTRRVERAGVATDQVIEKVLDINRF